MGNKHGKGAGNDSGAKKKHSVKLNPAFDGDSSIPEGEPAENAHTLESKEGELLFFADRETRNCHKKDIMHHITSKKLHSDLKNQNDTSPLSSSLDYDGHHKKAGQSVTDAKTPCSLFSAQSPENETTTNSGNASTDKFSTTDDSMLPDQPHIASHNVSDLTVLGDQSVILGNGPTRDIESDITNNCNAPVSTLTGNQTDLVSSGLCSPMNVLNSADKFPPKEEVSRSFEKDVTDFPHSGENGISDINHEDDFMYDQNADSSSGKDKSKLPTTGYDVSSQNSFRKEQTENTNILDTNTLNQSIPPTSQSKIESSTPSTMQFVQGLTEWSVLEEVGKLKVDIQLISKAVTENLLLLEKLSKYLDRESRVIKCWKHLAFVLNVPIEETRKFDLYTEHSPTEDLFNFLANIPELKVVDLREKLKAIYRNDLVETLNKASAGFRDEDPLSDLVNGQPKLIALLSPKLDIESRTIGNWKSLATQFEIPQKITEQFGMRGSGPTGALFLHVQTDENLRHLTMGQLFEHFRVMQRNDLVALLKKLGFEEKDSRFVRDEVVDGSEILADIGERLNKEIRAVKNWRHLAFRLKIPPEVYGAFDTSKATAKSPTKMMFEWLARWKPDLSTDDLVMGLKEIDRFDVVDLVTKETSFAKQAFSKLQAMHHDADNCTKKADLSQGLQMNASKKGLHIVGNEGKGNCMFHALCDQLKFKKEIVITHQELRKKLVEYLRQHPSLSDGTELAGFITNPSWTNYLQKMAEDGTWGDHLILLAAANCYECDILVVSSTPSHDCPITPVPPISSAVLLILGHIVEEHYVSLRPLRGDVSSRRFQGTDSQSACHEGPPIISLPLYSQQAKAQALVEQGCRRQSPCNPLQIGDQRAQGHHQPQDEIQIKSTSDRKAVLVRDLPLAVYSKICVKLNIIRDFFDDFRMVAEKLGFDKDTTQFIGQGRNPTDQIFTQCRRKVTVGMLIEILHDIPRMDVAEVLEDWVAKP